MSSAQKIIQAAAGNIVAGGVAPVGVSFDGTNDYLSRSSDLTGNTDSKTVTFSFWFYLSPNASASSTYRIYDAGGGFARVAIENGNFSILGTNGISTSGRFDSTNDVAFATWNHIIVSFDLTNASNRYVYLNDKVLAGSWSTYSNQNINFAQSTHFVGRSGASNADHFEGRLAGVYLDYTYRDLSVEANRRLFIDDDGLYVTPPTSGIISVPMDDPADPGRNDGTGGDFTLNGVVAQSGRGPNQYNAAASTFDGSADYLSKSNLLQGRDGRYCTCSFFLNPNTQTTVTDYGSSFSVQHDFNKKINIRYSPNNDVLDSVVTSNAFPYNKWIHVCFSFDSQDAQNTFQLFVDGVQQTVSGNFTNRTSNTFGFDTFNVAKYAAANNKDISDFWFTLGTAIDLSSENPFYDTETGKPKFLGASGELPTGSSPLIYLPMRADDAGNNLGTGGDFTVNSGPYVGARGPSEHWEESVEFDGTGNNHLKLNTATISDSKEFTVFLAFKPDDSGTHDWFELSGYNGSSRFTVLKVFTTGTSGSVEISSQDSSDYSNRLRAVGSGTINTDEWNTLLISGSMTSSSTFKVYLNGSDVTDNTFNYDNENLEFSKLATQGDSSGLYIGRQPLGGNPADGGGAIYYIDNVYTDFSQETNRLKFLDAFNNPTDIAAKIDSEEIAQPLIYLPFDDKTNLGKNSGTLGNFTEVGTLTDDGYVNG